MSTVGYADGRPQVQESADPYTKGEMLSVEDGIAETVRWRRGVKSIGGGAPGERWLPTLR